MLARPWPFGSIDAGIGVPGAVGSKFTSLPMASTATHWWLHSQEIAHSPPPLESTLRRAGAPGLCGLKVSSLPTASTAVHCVVVGHATAVRPMAPSIETGVGVPGLWGSNVTSYPKSSTPVHWLSYGQAIAVNALGADALSNWKLDQPPPAAAPATEGRSDEWRAGVAPNW